MYMIFEDIKMEVKCDFLNENNITTSPWTIKISSSAKVHFCASVFPQHKTLLALFTITYLVSCTVHQTLNFLTRKDCV